MIRQIAAVGLALLVVTGVAGLTAAVPGDGVPADDASNGAADEAGGPSEANETANETSPETGEQGNESVTAPRGPPSDTPGPVPEFVGDLHDEIASFDGGEQLGEAISSLTPGEDVSDETSDGEKTESGEETESSEESDDETTETDG